MHENEGRSASHPQVAHGFPKLLLPALYAVPVRGGPQQHADTGCQVPELVYVLWRNP